MPGAGFKTFTAGEVFTATDANTYLMQQAVMVFTNEAARDAAITSPSEGMHAYLTAPTVPAATGSTTLLPTGITTIYNGSVWVCTTPVFSRSNPGQTSPAFTTSYADLTFAGTALSVTLVTGTTALVSIAARILGNGSFARISVKTGTLASSDAYTIDQTGNLAYVTVGRTFVIGGLTAGTNTFTMQAINSANGASADLASIAVSGVA